MSERLRQVEKSWPPNSPFEQVPIEEHELYGSDLEAAREVQKLALIHNAAHQAQELAEKQLRKHAITQKAPEGTLFKIDDYDTPLRVQEFIADSDMPDGTRHGWVYVEDASHIEHFFAETLEIELGSGYAQYAISTTEDGRRFRCRLQDTSRIGLSRKPEHQ